MQTTGRFTCAYCGANNDTEVDPSGGREQEYEEDCQTCCRPNVLKIHFSSNGDAAHIVAEQENEW